MSKSFLASIYIENHDFPVDVFGIPLVVGQHVAVVRSNKTPSLVKCKIIGISKKVRATEVYNGKYSHLDDNVIALLPSDFPYKTGGYIEVKEDYYSVKCEICHIVKGKIVSTNQTFSTPRLDKIAVSLYS